MSAAPAEVRAATFGARAAGLAGVAARRLGWAPDVFWAVTPAELIGALVTEPARTAPPLSRADMMRMMERDHDKH